MTKVIVTSRSARGFWRAGMHFTRDEVEVDSGKLEEGVLEVLRAEPHLIVRDADPEGEDAKTKDRRRAGKNTNGQE